jgi:pimeloyl-ACP methyl ester carboxylesterase
MRRFALCQQRLRGALAVVPRRCERGRAPAHLTDAISSVTKGEPRMTSSASRFDAMGPYRTREASFRVALAAGALPHVFEAFLPEGVAHPLPFVVFSHGFGGHRRQSTFLLRHLASHGYAVVAPDHLGPGMPAMMALAMAAKARGEQVRPGLFFGELPRTRPVELLAMLAPVRAHLRDSLGVCLRDAEAAVVGHSFGAFTGLVAAARSAEIRAVVALAPAGVQGPVFVPAFAEELDLPALARVAVLVVAAERDTLVPLAGVEELVAQLSGPHRLLVLESADHVHFCDQVSQAHGFLAAITSMPDVAGALGTTLPYASLLPEAKAHRAICAAVTAHLHGAFHGDAEAGAFLKACSDDPAIPLRSQRRGSFPTP